MYLAPGGNKVSQKFINFIQVMLTSASLHIVENAERGLHGLGDILLLTLKSPWSEIQGFLRSTLNTSEVKCVGETTS